MLRGGRFQGPTKTLASEGAVGSEEVLGMARSVVAAAVKVLPTPSLEVMIGRGLAWAGLHDAREPAAPPP